MKRIVVWSVGALLSVVAARGISAQETACRKFGTALTWEESIEKAVAVARKEAKLVLVLHISGNFEDAGLT